jgi:hypothetical protein
MKVAPAFAPPAFYESGRTPPAPPGPRLPEIHLTSYYAPTWTTTLSKAFDRIIEMVRSLVYRVLRKKPPAPPKPPPKNGTQRVIQTIQRDRAEQAQKPSVINYAKRYGRQAGMQIGMKLFGPALQLVGSSLKVANYSVKSLFQDLPPRDFGLFDQPLASLKENFSKKTLMPIAALTFSSIVQNVTSSGIEKVALKTFSGDNPYFARGFGQLIAAPFVVYLSSQLGYPSTAFKIGNLPLLGRIPYAPVRDFPVFYVTTGYSIATLFYQAYTLHSQKKKQETFRRMRAANQ